MENYDTIVESYSLPSKGLLYNPPIEAEGELRSMTVKEEMKRLSPTDRPYKLMAGIIEDCMIKKPGRSVYDMCMADYQYLLQRLRVATYGPDYKFDIKCPNCGKQFSYTLDLDELEVKVLESISDIPTTVTLPKTKTVIGMKIQTPREIDNMIIRQAEIEKNNPGAPNQTLLLTLATSIDTIDGKKVNQLIAENFVRDLPLKDSNYLLKNIATLNSSVGLQLTLDCECDHCHEMVRTPFRIGSEFFGPEDD